MPAFAISLKEDGSITILGRITARGGTGLATGVDGEGNFLKQADISTITCKIFDLESNTPDTPIATPTVTISTDVLDTPVTTKVIWTKDDTGYNFIHDLSNTIFTGANRRYEVEYEVTLNGGIVFHGRYAGQTTPLRGS